MKRTGESRGRSIWSAVVLAGFLTLCVLALGVSTASASFPVYEGGWFPTIHNSSDPEEYSWEVTLGERQELVQVDDQEVAVYYSNGFRSGGIRAEQAHDADGATVPTTIRITDENVVSLTVLHREGNPAAGGAPFDYPVSDGVGWEGGFHTEIAVFGPPDEMELREQRERQERVTREEREAAEKRAVRAARCHVPALRGATLAGARERLRRANCRLGSIVKPRGVTAKGSRVVTQTAAPGASLAPDTRVGIKLGAGGSSPRH